MTEAVSVVKDARNLRSWEYTLIAVSLTTSNPDLGGGECNIVRIARGEYGLSGSLYTNVDVPDDMEMDTKIYRSTDGGETFQIQPYSIPRQTVYQAMNNFYKKIIMPSAADCSNFPQFNDTLVLISAQKFTFERCQVRTDEFPQYVPNGLYKGVIRTYGIFEITWEGLFDITQKVF
ncbi:uncharacterized protein LOC108108093 [Drosophila eugracilis]|uniref:uncharacterized protein LOC108108093 n=1 Tax=Drosophila eugracilis TaxID=29029 RepID=UPI0007E5CADB|nr:uncharacterized protein LOC108108093 [Drosophila eugracilis]